MEQQRCRVIVLAAQRSGITDPLAASRGTSHKCLIPFAGKPLIAHVLDVVCAYPAVGDVTVSIEQDAFAAVRAALGDAPAEGAPIRFAAAADNLADSVFAAAEGHDGPLLITTADNALLTPVSLFAMLRALHDHDVAIALAPREAVLAAHPEGQRRFYGFRDGAYSNCNLYGIAHPKALKAAEIFRGGGQFSKKAGRIIEAFGLINLLLMRAGMLTLPRALRRISQRIGLDIAPVVLSDGSQAIDVDNERTYAIAASVLGARIARLGSTARRLREVA